MTNPCDLLYEQWDWNVEPFGLPPKHNLWLLRKIKGKILSLKEPTDGYILDDGGGCGYLFNFLSEKERKNYVNLDVSIHLLKMSKGHMVRGVAENLPFKEESFKLVVSSEVLEHVNDKIKTIKEIHRVLKNSNSLILDTPRVGCNKAWNKLRNKLLYCALLPFAVPSRLQYVVTKKVRGRRIAIPKGLRDEPSHEEWLQDLMEEIGFKVVFRSRVHVLWWWWTYFPIWLLEIMERRYSGSELCHKLIFKAIK